MRLYLLFTLFLGMSLAAKAQTTSEKIDQILAEKKALEEKKKQLLVDLEELRLTKIQEDLEKVGYPKGKEHPIVKHSAIVLSYNEEHEQADWVTHIVVPAASEGKLSRTNDFRVDPKVETGSSDKPDYWYSGFDRGHIAPSADFNWSKTAISESYFYSNMAPQRPELNRERWADLERWVRQQVFSHNEQLIVVAGGILDKELPKIPQGSKRVSIPKEFYKIVLDLEGDTKRAIGFILPNKECKDPVISYAVSVDEIEKRTGLDFFSNLDDDLEKELEAQSNIVVWEKTKDGGIPDYPPLKISERPKNTINTSDAPYFIGQKVTVCGTVVSSKKTGSGAVFLNLDTKFPKQVFSVSIWPSDVKNFSYTPEVELMEQQVCVTGKITEYKDTPTMNIPDEKKLIFIDEQK